MQKEDEEEEDGEEMLVCVKQSLSNMSPTSDPFSRPSVCLSPPHDASLLFSCPRHPIQTSLCQEACKSPFSDSLVHPSILLNEQLDKKLPLFERMCLEIKSESFLRKSTSSVP